MKRDYELDEQQRQERTIQRQLDSNSLNVFIELHIVKRAIKRAQERIFKEASNKS